MNLSKHPLVPWLFFGLVLTFWGFRLTTNTDDGDPVLRGMLLVLGLSGVLTAVIAKGAELGVLASRRASDLDSSF